MKSINTISTYKVNGDRKDGIDPQKLIVESHWNYKALVVLKCGEKEVIVSVGELNRAIENACNAHTF